MQVILILVSVCFCVLIFHLLGNSIRLALVKSGVITSLEILTMLEILSLFELVTYSSLLASWSALLFFKLILGLLIVKKKQIKFDEIPILNPDWENYLSGTRLFIGIIFLLLIVTFMIAIIAPPNTFDSMTYHMPRVSHWIQQRSISFFPTGIPRQNYSMPFAEYAILTLQILSKSDRFANLVQWASYFLIIVLASLVAAEFSLNKFSQLLASTIVATIPMVVMQSATSQNDLVVGVFCLTFLLFMIKLTKTNSVTEVFFAGSSLGLGMLAKGTGYIFCAAIGTVLGISYLFRNKQNLLKPLLMLFSVIALAVVFNAGHMIRTSQHYDDPLFSANQRTLIDELSIKNTGVNLIRNGVIHLATPNTKLNQAIEESVNKLLGKENSNPASTFPGADFTIEYSINEDNSGNLIHFLIISSALVVGPWMQPRSKKSLALFVIILVAVVLFSASLKWQPWTSRLQTPLFLLGSIYLAVVLDKLGVSKTMLQGGGVVLFISCLPYLLLATPRPVLPVFPKDSPIKESKLYLYTANRIDKYLLAHPHLDEEIRPIKLNYIKHRSIFLTSRERLYFFAYDSLYEEFNQVLDLAQVYETDVIGFVLASNSWEYPIWVAYDRHAKQGYPKFAHVFVDQSGVEHIGKTQYLPDLIIASSNVDHNLASMRDYELIFKTNTLLLYKMH